MPLAAPPATILAAILTSLFFVSGVLALVYEVLWQRQLAFVFGSAAPATATVLAAYFAGLGAGSLALGAAARRWPRPLRAYALLEVLVGCGALLVVPLLIGFERVYPWLAAHLVSGAAPSLALKALLAFVALALPTFCMGGTLPVLAGLADHGQRRLGVNAGLLYVANTAGAGLGALAVPFLLLPRLGATASLVSCAFGNLSLAAAAWLLDRRWPPDRLDASGVSAKPAGLPPTLSWTESSVLLATASGWITFALQVLWNRAFAQVHENSVYSFAAIAAVFILALAAGAQAARVALRRGLSPELVLGCAWLLGAALIAVAPWLFLQLTGGLDYLPSAGGWFGSALRLVRLAVAVLFLPVTLLGMALPALMERAGRASAVPTSELLGRLLAANVAGSVAGTLTAGFLLPAWLGLWRAALLTAALTAVAGACQLGRVNRRVRPVLVLGVAFGLWPLAGIEWPRVRLGEDETLVSVTEGAHGIVAVVEHGGSRRLKLDNHYVLGGTVAGGDERMQAHIPLLLHPSPRRAVVLGLGTGITAGGVLFHPVAHLDALELVPEVVDAARVHFADANAGVIEDPRTHVVVEDARSYLKSAAARYDVIIGDLVVPWRPGESALFTLEHFAAARRALAPGGLFCQWLPLFQLSEAELNILLRTFLSVFPRALVWRGDFSADEPALALVGLAQPFALEPAQIGRRIRELRADPLNPQLREPIAYWMHFAGVLERQDLPATDRRINREDRPWIELMGPLQHAGSRTGLFTGRRLQAWLDDLRQRSQDRVTGFGPAELAGVEAGRLLTEFSLALSARNEQAATAAQARLRGLLPPQAFEYIFEPRNDEN